MQLGALHTQLAGAPLTGTVKVCAATTGKELLTFPCRHNNVRFSPDGRRLFTYYTFELSPDLDRALRELMSVATDSRERLGEADGIPIVTAMAAFEAPPGKG